MDVSFLMTYYGGHLVSYNRLWIGSKDIELDLSKDKIFRDEERHQKIHVYFHELPVMTPKAAKAGCSRDCMDYKVSGW
jgi:hypothetical protein